jgi:hypothetical protein
MRPPAGELREEAFSDVTGEKTSPEPRNDRNGFLPERHLLPDPRIGGPLRVTTAEGLIKTNEVEYICSPARYSAPPASSG